MKSRKQDEHSPLLDKKNDSGSDSDDESRLDFKIAKTIENGVVRVGEAIKNLSSQDKKNQPHPNNKKKKSIKIPVNVEFYSKKEDEKPKPAEEIDMVSLVALKIVGFFNPNILPIDESMIKPNSIIKRAHDIINDILLIKNDCERLRDQFDAIDKRFKNTPIIKNEFFNFQVQLNHSLLLVQNKADEISNHDIFEFFRQYTYQDWLEIEKWFDLEATAKTNEPKDLLKLFKPFVDLLLELKARALSHRHHLLDIRNRALTYALRHDVIDPLLKDFLMLIDKHYDVNPVFNDKIKENIKQLKAYARQFNDIFLMIENFNYLMRESGMKFSEIAHLKWSKIIYLCQAIFDAVSSLDVTMSYHKIKSDIKLKWISPQQLNAYAHYRLTMFPDLSTEEDGFFIDASVQQKNHL